MVTPVLVLAVASLCWPSAPGHRRLRAITGTAHRLAPVRYLPRPTTFLVVATSSALGLAAAGIGGALAAALVATTAWRRHTARRTLRDTFTAMDALVEALRSMVADLRAGAHPATAAESAAADAPPQAATAMHAIAAAARLDGDVHRALAASRATTPAAAQILTHLARAWLLVQRHGVPLAEVLDAVRGDLHTRVRFARQVQARMAGPRASATVLALLPAIGITLGEAMRAHPLHVLRATPAGQILLIIGTILACAGVAWSARLTNQVVLHD
jgi:tight adherence protein B